MSAPFSILNNQISYYTHSQINRYLYDLKGGIRKSNLQAARIIAKSNSPSHFDSSKFDAALQSIERQQSAFNLSFMTEMRGVHRGLSDINNSIGYLHDDINYNFNNLASLFQTGMGAIINHLFLQQQEFVVFQENLFRQFANLQGSIDNWEYNRAQEKVNMGKILFEQYLENPKEYPLLQASKENFIQSLKHFNGNPIVFLYLGNIYELPTDKYSLEEASKNYSMAVSFSRGANNTSLLTHSLFHLSWINYVMGNIDDAINHGLEAVKIIENTFFEKKNIYNTDRQASKIIEKYYGQGILHADALISSLAKQSKEPFRKKMPEEIPELYYNLAKFFALKKDAKKSLSYLKYAIDNYGKGYAEKANNDLDFQYIRNDLCDFLIPFADK